MQKHGTQQTKEEEEHLILRSEIQSFNDATEHNRTILGVPDKKVDLKSMPTPLRWFAYCVGTLFVLMAIGMLVQYLNG
ncbi:hypothetical protein [Paenibacillus lutrae]|uniref:Uncharacterized protein n=1 Tax=Paenibacillus lutrae TaxID=2078573 RepID=A0A7X3K1Z7_9BACL|nr:hypothetical protein [Paenibacillus lutrae]MVP02451.1 hypothetical protein [Paenibacillus lutrae]